MLISHFLYCFRYYSTFIISIFFLLTFKFSVILLSAAPFLVPLFIAH
jgi:hypothetical protein